jgi:UDP-GlcNAc:undecaprenyl-phosphate GlcNAc-1-phosphate transferase
LTAGIAILFLIFIESFNNPLTGSLAEGWPYWLTVTITLFWLGFMMNTVNFLDGLDGLATGVAAIASLLIFFHATFQLNQVSVGLLPLALFGATLGFLIYNFYPSKIFMGSGAYFLGYALGTLSIIGGAKMATILLVMGLPLSDVGWQIVRRLSRGKNPMLGDRGHLHFRLVDMGYSQRNIVLGYYAFSLIFGGIALITTSRLFKFLSLLIMGMILVGTFVLVSWTASKKPQPKSNQ